MEKWIKSCLTVVATLLLLTASSQNIGSFSGSKKGNGYNFNFYNPLVSGNKTFTSSIVNSGPVQMLTDTTAIFDSTLMQYDLDSIPEQLIFYNTTTKFYIKSDSLNRLNKKIISNKYYITSGMPLGV